MVDGASRSSRLAGGLLCAEAPKLRPKSKDLFHDAALSCRARSPPRFAALPVGADAALSGVLASRLGAATPPTRRDRRRPRVAAARWQRHFEARGARPVQPRTA